MGGCSKLLSVCRLDLEVVCAIYEVEGNAITNDFSFDFQFEFPVSSFITDGTTASFVSTRFVIEFVSSSLGSRPASSIGSLTVFSNRV